MGYNPPAKGIIRFDGQDVTEQPVYEKVRYGIGYVPEDRRIFPNLTVVENLEVAQLPARSERTVWNVERVFSTFPIDSN